MKTTIKTGTPTLLLVAGQRELNLARGVPMPEFLHSLEKFAKLADFQSIANPIPPKIAITGVALMMNLPADHAIYVEIIPQEPSKVNDILFVLAPLQRKTKAQPNAINATIGPYDANKTPLLGACASPIVPKILFLSK